ncbi:hypothetical protein L1987_57812 [Smallanthus sonchifolius]|uniref:Uncharacterized protein n=1 Tax=Smallanthus sonchifolius TaxID=185202 RepID=A0ACB9DE16_9ASTR|nr:hypothetical protein L1987_57812 [Smallanthus sonchifolius]
MSSCADPISTSDAGDETTEHRLAPVSREEIPEAVEPANEPVPKRPRIDLKDWEWMSWTLQAWRDLKENAFEIMAEQEQFDQTLRTTFDRVAVEQRATKAEYRATAAEECAESTMPLEVGCVMLASATVQTGALSHILRQTYCLRVVHVASYVVET